MSLCLFVFPFLVRFLTRPSDWCSSCSCVFCAFVCVVVYVYVVCVYRFLCMLLCVFVFMCVCVYMSFCVSWLLVCVCVCVCEIEERLIGDDREGMERRGVDAKTTRCIPPGICFCVYLLPASGCLLWILRVTIMCGFRRESKGRKRGGHIGYSPRP